MSFAIVFDGLKKSVSKFGAVYGEGMTRQPELAPYASVGELLAALKMSSPLSLEARDAITLGLIAEQQRAAHPLWQTLLLAAYEPMLRRLRTRLGNKDDAELDQCVVMAFLEAAQEISLLHPPQKAALHLRRATENAVFRTLRGDRREAANAPLDEGTLPCDPHRPAPQELALAVKEMAQVIGNKPNGREVVAALGAVCGGDESLKEYVARIHGNLSAAEQKREYARLQRMVNRSMKRARWALGDDRYTARVQ